MARLGESAGTVPADEDVVLAVDIGGTKLAAALAGPQGQLSGVTERPTPPAGTAEEVWAALAGLIETVLAGRSVRRVGVGCGGPMRWPSGVVSPLNIAGWRDFALADRLRDLLPGARLRLHNDAIAAAVGEHWCGVGRGSAAFLGIVVSTGVGGGLVLDGRIFSGPSGNAGHLGHLVVDPHGPPCACGGRGCLEAIARGPAIVEWAIANGWAGEPTAPALARAAAEGLPLALAAMARAGQAVGVALASTAALLDLDAIAVAGGVAAAGAPLFGPLLEAYRRHAGLAYAKRVRLRPAVLGRRAGLTGAAAFWLAGERYWPVGQD